MVLYLILKYAKSLIELKNCTKRLKKMKRIIDNRKLFGITKDANLTELKKIYRNLMKEWHPDNFKEGDEQLIEAEIKSKTIIEAYHFLVSIAPETIAASLDQYTNTLNTSSIEDFEYKTETLTISFSDGSCYEYFAVPKSVYVKLVNAPAQARFLRRHIATEFIYRSTNKLVAA